MKRADADLNPYACSCPHDHDEISLKKQFGQHFLRDQAVVDEMLESVTLTEHSSVCEIGCGDGFLTESILDHHPERVWSFEIDPEWVEYMRRECQNPALMLFEEDILQVDLERLVLHKPWILLSNVPYQITFPLLYRIHAHRHLFSEGAIMIQEEVAQKICASSGREYGVQSLFFQHYFTWNLLCKVPPTAFVPPPKVYSRVLHFKPREHKPEIPDEEKFWRFVKLCFAKPRRTLQNNIRATHYVTYAELLKDWAHLRAQQMTFDDFLTAWNAIRSASIR